MRPLRHQAVVESTHAEVNECVSNSAVVPAIVVLAGALGQGLQGADHGGAPDLVQGAVDVDGAVLVGSDAQASRVDTLRLFIRATQRVSSMPRVVAVLTEAGDAVLARLAQQLGLVEAIADRSRSAGDEREVGETDLAGRHRPRALAQPLQLLAGADSINGCGAAHVAVGLEP